ncbi:hypothetical protein J3Q64DRAFT_1851002 [Phycomyces blakesleeanus]|uniref:Probable RNA-binding protein 18 n=1 Tax=Phycomyces blakesleeanus TaxID=4837 RepID=A0ABR3AS30_PHYBL
MANHTSYTKRLYISNLDTAVDEYAVVKLFEPFGKITFLDYMFHWSGPKKGQPRGYCFLEYEKKEEALKAMSALHGRIVKGRPLVVSFAHMTNQEDSSSRRGQTSTNSLHRPNTFTILRTQKMANASTDAKINAIERKLAMLEQQRIDPTPTKPKPKQVQTSTHQQQSSGPRLSGYQQRSIRSALSTEATNSRFPAKEPYKRRYKPY